MIKQHLAHRAAVFAKAVGEFKVGQWKKAVRGCV